MRMFLCGNSENQPAEDIAASGLPSPCGNCFLETWRQMDALQDRRAGGLNGKASLWRCSQLASRRQCDGAGTRASRRNLLWHKDPV